MVWGLPGARTKVLADIGSHVGFSLRRGGMIMVLSGRTKLGITIAVSVIAALASVLLALLLLVLAVFLIVWGQVPERTEAFVKGLPYGNSLLKALAKLDLKASGRD
jgi:hypothetical protein